MELLSSIDTMSLAELRKILRDNDVKETCSSKKELMLQVSDVLQTNMMIHELLSETSESHEPQECKESSDSLSSSERDSLRDQQDKEYQESLQMDLAKQSQQVESIEELTEELTVEDLRAKRLLYYSQ